MSDNSNRELVLAPASKKQELFLNSNATITLAGGSAGSGKTYTSLLIALKFMQHPRATGVIFRRNSKMINSPGSIWHEAVAMYSSIYKTGLKIRSRDNEIVFPNGALLKFSHMQHASNMYDHKGGQYSLVIFDEATDFTEEMIVYLLSRMRNAHVDYTPQMFLMTNPDYNSFLRLWIEDFYLDQSGIPREELAGVKRYFFRQGNTMMWYDSLEQAEVVHGKGAESGITSFCFIPANCRDNPPLLKSQPDYISRLMSLPRVEMERLLLGSWYARQESSGLFKREWVELVDYPNGRARQRIRAWDLAFSKPSEQNPDPDWTRGVLVSKDAAKVYTIEDCVGMRERVHKVEELIFQTAIQDGFDTVVSIPQDPNAAAGAYARDLQRRLAELGFTCRLQRPVKSKVTRFAPFSSLAQAGFVNVVKAEWNKELFDELEIFNGDRKNKDDICDCISDCITLLNKDVNLPTFSLPEMMQSSNFNFAQPVLPIDNMPVITKGEFTFG
jgi:predicted phage terminase large subunit-like protein